MSQEPLFSIIMPNYNKARFIKESIESVLVQTYRHWELVIVDDASTDDSVEVINTFLPNNKIKLIQIKTNKGVGYAARTAVEQSSGEIIGTLDSDDILVEDALMIMVNEYQTHPEYGLIYSNHYKTDNNLKVLGKVNLLDPLPDNKCLQDICLSVGQFDPNISFFFRTFTRSAYDKTEGFDINLLCYEDRDIYYKLEKVTRVKCINKCLGYYRDSHEVGAYRSNSNVLYYWFICEYNETNRRLGGNLPFISKKNISPLLCNLMYISLRKHTKIGKKGLRKRLHNFLFGMGQSKLETNKLMAFLYFLNSFVYGYYPITMNRIKKFITPGHSEK